MRQRQHQRGEVGGEHLGRVERLAARVRGLLPQAVGDARPLPRRAAGALRGGGLAGAGGDQVGDAGGDVELGAAREAGVDHHRDAVERDRGLGDRGREHDPAAALGIAADRGALRGGLDLAVERQDRHLGQALGQPLAGALDLADAGEEGEQIALLRRARR